MYCTECGTRNRDDARYCSKCGRSLTEPDETTISLQAAEIEDETGEHVDLPIEDLEPGQALLVVKRGPNAGSKFLLDKDVTTVGRHPESDIFLDDITVSRRHAELRRKDERFVVRDVGALNGTYVNRERVDETQLASGDEVQIGKFKLLFLLKD